MKQDLSLSGLKFEALICEQNKHTLTLTLNRPEKKNAINEVMATELNYALAFAKQNDDVRVVVFAARGDVFCAGADLAAMRGEQQETESTVPKLGYNSPHGLQHGSGINQVGVLLRDLCKPVVVKAQGSVLAGGLLLVTNATHVIASDNAKFSAPEIKRGLWPYMVMAGLFRVVPKRVGLDWIMRGHPVSAETALSWGLINQVCSSGKLDTIVDELVLELSQQPPKTMQLGLEAYNRQEALAFEAAMPYLSDMLDKTKKEGDAQEGIAAFFEKRQPSWLEE